MKEFKRPFIARFAKTILKSNGVTPRCKRCGSRYNLTADHVYPVSKGGTTNIDNLQWLCYDCNELKADKVEAKK
jgi:5-methylcytosine-specific restriction endonuclease McrA